MARERSLEQKVADWQNAFRAVQEELTPAPLRVMLKALTDTAPPDNANGDIEAAQTYLSQVNAATGIARIVFTNDRAAAVVAALLTQGGVSRPQLDVIEGSEG